MRKQIVFLMGVVFLFSALTAVQAQKMTVKDSEGHVLMEVNDEGVIGSIMLPDAKTALSTELHKLYNLNGVLIWNGDTLGTAGSAGGWTDGGTDVYLTTTEDNVGIGTTSPGHKLDVRGDIITGVDGSGGSLWLAAADATDEGGQIGWNGAGSYDDWVQDIYQNDMRFFTNSAGNNKVQLFNAGAGSMDLEIGGKVSISGTQVLYLPDQTDFQGTLIIGSGGGSLSHSTGDDGRYNTACGIGALNSVSKSMGVTAIGHQALFSITEYGSRCVAVGHQALFSNERPFNTAVGYQSMYNNTDGEKNTAMGDCSLLSNTEGDNNTALGYSAMKDNTSGNHNVATGLNALEWNTTGNENTAIGNGALLLNKQGSYNTAVGRNAMQGNTGDENTALGHEALFENETGEKNVAVGNMALYSCSTSGSNTAVGHKAMYSQTSGSYNTVVGASAMYANATGIHNTIIGYNADASNSAMAAGNENTVIGSQTGNGAGSHSKSGCVFIGFKAGYYETNDDKLYIENSDTSFPLIGGDFYLNRVGINTGNPSVSFEVYATDAIKIPVGNTVSRPASPAAGMMRFNTSTLKFEGYTGSAWVNLH